MAWLNLTMPNQTVKNCPKWNFSRKTTNKIFMYLLAPFILQNLKKILRADPELWGYAIFRPRMAHLSLTIFFGTNHYYYFHLSIGPFHCAKFKNSYSGSNVKDVSFLCPKWSICPKQKIFWKINVILIYLLAPFIV